MKHAPTKLVPNKPNDKLLNTIDFLREQAERGELLGIAYILQWKGNLVSSGYNLADMKARALVGELEYLQHEIVEKHP